jgi:dolichol-phosphate mannosyltransferase
MTTMDVGREPVPWSTGGSDTAVATTLIVPTRNEEGNVAELLRRLEPVLVQGSEVIFVDDSDDGTVAAIEAAGATASFPVRVHHREPDDRADGLGGAVRAGLALAERDWCVVMDADLQHPPEVVPQLVAEGVRTQSQLVVATRYNGAGDAESFSRGRQAMSTWATRITKAFFPKRLAGITDPMTGFFAVRRDAVDVDALRPKGFKILLEIAVRCAPLKVTEVPFHFGRRFAGESKASLREVVRLLTLLTHLWFDASTSRRASRMVAFGLVGVSGLVVNSLALYVASGIGHLHYLWGTIVATLVSTTWNWAVLETLVYPGGARRQALRRLTAFGLVNVAALALRVPLMALLVERLGVNYLLANLVSLLVLFTVRFAVSDNLIFRSTAMTQIDKTPDVPADANGGAADPLDGSPNGNTLAATSTPLNGSSLNGSSLNGSSLNGSSLNGSSLNGSSLNGSSLNGSSLNGHTARDQAPARHEGYLRYRYDVPGVATIGSEVKLPELEWFLMPFQTRGPFDIEIRVAKVGRMRRHVTFTADGSSERLYEEHVGGLGANFKIDMGETIHVTAGPLLLHSPHVLYTNIVEMLLRFLAVSKGRVLLHSACVELSGRGVMLSARTDTGKTGTILRLIREQGAVFLSDDMTIIDPDGLAHCFPKPLTISHHTLLAVDSHGLSKSEWRKLRLQSRLHSKEGRLFGMKLAQMNLPIMTFNAVTQAIVPPPKYDVDRLVPCDVVREVQVHDMFIIERGPNAMVEVDDEQALVELIENTDDAYGFPPFATLAPTLHMAGMDYEELRAREKELLERTLQHIRVRRLVRDDFGWPAEISQLVTGTAAEVPPTAVIATQVGEAPVAGRHIAEAPASSPVVPAEGVPPHLRPLPVYADVHARTASA